MFQKNNDQFNNIVSTQQVVGVQILETQKSGCEEQKLVADKVAKKGPTKEV